MDNVLRKGFSERFGTEAQEKWLHIPDAVAVGRSKDGLKLAAVSARWLKGSWTGESAFVKWCGFAPYVSKSWTKEVMKAASGLVEEVENVPTSGFKISLDLNYGQLMEGRGAARPTRQPLLMPNCDLSTCGMSFALFYSYSKPVIAVEDPRGWAVMVSQAQVVKLMAARACSSADRLELPGPLVYVFSRHGFTIDFPDGQLARAAIDDKGVDDVKKAAASSKKAAALEVGQICTDVSKHEDVVYLGMFPQDLASSEMETVCTSMQPALAHVCTAAKAAFNDIGFKLDGADFTESMENPMAEALWNRLQPLTAHNASKLSNAMQTWTKLHKKLAPTFACIGEFTPDGFTFLDLRDFPDVKKHSIESLLVARPDDIDVIKSGFRVKVKDLSIWSSKLLGFLEQPTGVFQTCEEKAKDLACLSKGYAEYGRKLFVKAHDSELKKCATFEYSYQKVITELEARRKWLDSLYEACIELMDLIVQNSDTARSLAESLAANCCKKLKTLFPALPIRTSANERG